MSTPRVSGPGIVHEDAPGVGIPGVGAPREGVARDGGVPLVGLRVEDLRRRGVRVVGQLPRLGGLELAVQAGEVGLHLRRGRRLPQVQPQQLLLGLLDALLELLLRVVVAVGAGGGCWGSAAEEARGCHGRRRGG